MSDTDEAKAAEEAAAKAKPAEDAAAAAEDNTDYKAEAEKWKALSRKHENQAKSNADAAKRLKDAEDAQKTAEERSAARLAELEAKVNATESRAMRAEVASAKGLTAAQARRLQGSTIEELEADADDLLDSFKPAGKAVDGSDKDGTGKPKEKLRTGAAPTGTEPDEMDPAKLAAQISRI